MKRIIALSLGLVVCTSIFAQSSQPFRLHLQRIGVSASFDQDMVQGFSANTFSDMAGITNLTESYGLNLDENDIYSGYCENPALRLMTAWQISDSKFELQTSLLSIINRYDGLTYYGEGLEKYENYLSLHSWGDELGLDFAVVRRFTAGPFSMQLGLGANTGLSYNNAIEVSGSIQSESKLASFESTSFGRLTAEDFNEYHIETIDVKNGISQRVYGQLGLSATLFRRVEIGLEGRWGYGYRTHNGGSKINTNLRSVGAALRWVLY